jgi:S-formylglutathione hydrolase FrmB
VVIVGESVTFSVAATGASPLSYQWLKNEVNIPAATSTSYTINNVQTNAAGSYSVVVTNIAGSLTSSNAVLVIIPPPLLAVLRQGANLVLSWPTNWAGFTLQSTTNAVVSPGWISNMPPPVVSGGNYVATNAITGNQKLYRLKK